MVLAVDVNYSERNAKAVGVVFDWTDVKASDVIIVHLTDVEEYIPGEFYKRELPCILKVISKVKIEDIQAIVVDGYVYLDNDKKYGLGAYLWEALEKSIPVIGVAKKTYHENEKNVFALTRGESKNPLYISAIGIELEHAVELVRHMQGNHRIPTILKDLDKLSMEH